MSAVLPASSMAAAMVPMKSLSLTSFAKSSVRREKVPGFFSGDDARTYLRI